MLRATKLWLHRTESFQNLQLASECRRAAQRLKEAAELGTRAHAIGMAKDLLGDLLRSAHLDKSIAPGQQTATGCSS